MRKLIVVILADILAVVSLAKADDTKVQLMFGQISDDMKADSTTLLGGGVGVGFHGAGAGARGVGWR